MSLTLPSSRLSRQDLINWLRLARSENVGPITFRHLLSRYGDVEPALQALPELAARGGRRKPIRICPVAEAERELESLEALGASVLTIADGAYPRPLAAVEDAPPLIFSLGDTALLQRPVVGIVGARNASAAGRSLAGRFAREMSEAGWLVVSGLARGIDSAAHQGALAAGTAAVLAGGLDIAYPPQNAELQAAIAERGLLLAERPPGSEPQARHFPRRNRIIAGLSLGVVVVEAALRSGSLITARLALEQGREVLAVPGSPLDPRARGCNALLRDGAVLVEETADILAALGDPGRQVCEAASETYAPGEDWESAASETETARARLRQLLSPTAVTVDELVRQCQLSAAVVSLILVEMELAGLVERRPGNRVALTVVAD